MRLADSTLVFALVAASWSLGQAEYEVWASDQSNTVPGQSALGVQGSLLWIYDSEDIEKQVKWGRSASPLSCSPNASEGPCDIRDVFPLALEESATVDPTGTLLTTTGETLADSTTFGRLHGVIGDPQNQYVVANMFNPSGGYVGVISVATKEAIALFRVTQYSFEGNDAARSVHMSFWSSDGSAILVDNLNGKAMERIDVTRDADGVITSIAFNKSASLGLGKAQGVVQEATVFLGENAFGNQMMGSLIGSYLVADLGDETPQGLCKENGCSGTDGASGGRPNNVPICPITSGNGLVYITLGGGGMFVADTQTTPMTILSEYGNQVVYGAGCGGIEVDNGLVYMNSGVSASGAGATQSMFAVWGFEDAAFRRPGEAGENLPAPDIVFDDPTNTATGGNQNGDASNESGQLPGTTARRDSHGMDITVNQRYLHVVDRIQNVMEVFDVTDNTRTTYTLVDERDGFFRTILDWFARILRFLFRREVAGCLNKSVDGVPSNDPAPDLFERTPDGKYLMIALRGPAPVSVGHSAQGSCPGVGIVELSSDGSTGRLIDVIRTSNTVSDEIPVVSVAGGVEYSGPERSDVHGTIVVPK